VFGSVKLKFVLVSIIAVVAVGALATAGLAENISGKVLDPQGSAITDAQVRLFDRNGGEMRSTISSKEGAYTFQDIPAGTYLLEADGPSGTLRGSEEVVVKGDETKDLKLAISGTRTDVLVTASGTPLTLDEISKSLDVVDSEDIDLRNELSVSELIRNVPGLRIQTLEGPGSFTEIKTRGLRAQGSRNVKVACPMRGATTRPPSRARCRAGTRSTWRSAGWRRWMEIPRPPSTRSRTPSA